MNIRLKILAAASGAILLLGGAVSAEAQAFKLNQLITPVSQGLIYSNGSPIGNAVATSAPTVLYITATSTTATSSLSHLSATQLAIGTLTGILKAVGGYVQTALIDLTTDVSGLLPVANGGTASSTLSGILKGNGTAQVKTAIPNTDYQIPITLTTTGTSGAATFNGTTLNVPQYAGTTYLAGTGLTLTTNTFSVNTSQNISTLSNLTSNGLVKTSGSTGALSIATNGTDYTLLTANTCSAGQHVSAITAAGIITCSADSSGGGGSGVGTVATSTLEASGQIPFFSSTAGYPALIAGTSTLVWNNTNGRLGVGSSTPSQNLVVSGNAYIGQDGLATGSLGTVFNTYTTDLTSNVIINSFQAVGAAPAAGNIQALQFNVTDTGSANVGTLTGLNGLATKSGSGTLTTLTGVQASARVSGTVAATSVLGFNSQLRVQTGSSAATAVDFNASASTVTGSITSAYGLKIAAKKITNVGTGYGVAQDGTSDLNYFLGLTGFASSTPTYPLSVNTGATGASIDSSGTLRLNALGTGLLKSTSGVVSVGSAGTDYQAPITLTTTGTSGAATFIANTLNIPQYAGTTYTATYPVTLTGSAFGFAGLATSTLSWATSGLAYVVNGNTVASVATSTLTASSPLTGSFTQIGTGGSLGCQTASGSQAGCLSSADWTTFNGKLSGNQTITLSGAITGSGATAITTAFGAAAANSVLVNATGASAVPAFAATSTLGIAISDTRGTLTVGRGGTGIVSVADGALLFGGAGGGTANLTALATSTGGFLGESFTTGRPAWMATSTLGIAISDTTGTLAATRGGTGLASFSTGQIFYASNSTTIAALAIGTPGQVLGVSGGIPAWVATSTGAGANFFTNSGNSTSLSTGVNLGIGTSTPFARLALQMNYGDTASTLFAIGSSTAVGGGTASTLFNINQIASGVLAYLGMGTTSPIGFFSAVAPASPTMIASSSMYTTAGTYTVTIPANALVKITAIGAGGSCSFSGSASLSGAGAVVGTTTLTGITAGSYTVHVAAAGNSTSGGTGFQKGGNGDTTTNFGSGGGGSSDFGGLVIASGGGGCGNNNNGQDASGTSGGAGGAGGANGAGGGGGSGTAGGNGVGSGAGGGGSGGSLATGVGTSGNFGGPATAGNSPTKGGYVFIEVDSFVNTSIPTTGYLQYLSGAIAGVQYAGENVIDWFGNLYTNGPTPTAATCTGFSASLGADNRTGTITMTSGSSCTFNFGSTWKSLPSCSITPETALTTIKAVPSTTQLAITFGTSQTQFGYICQAHLTQ